MITIKSNDLAALGRALADERKKIRAYADDKFTLAVRETYADVVVNTPQYSGTLASNWYVGTSPTAGFNDLRPGFGYPNAAPFQKGNDPAVGVGFSHFNGSFKYGQQVFIYNTAPYADDVDVGFGPEGRAIRPVNLVQGKVYMLMNQMPNWKSKGWKA
jgi:hypothetical protein